MKTIKSKMYRLGHICRGIINVGLRKNIKIKGGVVKKPISCRYAFPTIPLEVVRSIQPTLNVTLQDRNTPHAQIRKRGKGQRFP